MKYMEIFYTQVKRIMDTLPIGYYAGCRINAVLDENSDSSYIDLITKNIVISYKMIENVMKNVEDENVVEFCLRCLLYHEISHAIMTPPTLNKYSSRELKTILNIMEDERIENAMRYYYVGVDFEKNIALINGWDENNKEEPKDARQAFYQVVRYHYGKEDWVNRAKNIVNRYADLDSNAKYIYAYVRDTEKLWEEIEYFYDSGIERNGNEKCDEFSFGAGSGDMIDECIKSLGQINDAAVTREELNEILKKMFEDKKTERIKSIVENVFNKVESFEKSDAIKEILPIIQSFNRKNAAGSAMASYSGVINPRNVARGDWRLFERKAQERGANKFCGVHINLFLDCSGSFECNENKANQIISALTQAENLDKNFTFDIVYCGVGEKVVNNKFNRMMRCGGRNNLDSEIFEIYRRLQKPNTYNYNIVLFDGDAFSALDYRESLRFYKNFGAFNHSNCTIISDDANKMAIEKYAPSARLIFTNNYVTELHKNVVNALRFAFR